MYIIRDTQTSIDHDCPYYNVCHADIIFLSEDELKKYFEKNKIFLSEEKIDDKSITSWIQILEEINKFGIVIYFATKKKRCYNQQKYWDNNQPADMREIYINKFNQTKNYYVSVDSYMFSCFTEKNVIFYEIAKYKHNNKTFYTLQIDTSNDVSYSSETEQSDESETDSE